MWPGGEGKYSIDAIYLLCRPLIQGLADEWLGRSRGGLTTTFHLACDGKGRPLSVVITPGQRHDSMQVEAVLEGIRVPRPDGRERGPPPIWSAHR